MGRKTTKPKKQEKIDDRSFCGTWSSDLIYEFDTEKYPSHEGFVIAQDEKGMYMTERRHVDSKLMDPNRVAKRSMSTIDDEKMNYFKNGLIKIAVEEEVKEN
jgi:hypothetical protein